MRRHLFFDTSLFAITDNHLANAVATKSVSAVGRVKCYKKRAIVRATSPFLQPIGDRLHCRRTQVDRLSLRTASLAPNPQTLTGRIKVTNIQLTNFVSSQSIAPQQPEQSIVSLASFRCPVAPAQNSLKSWSVNPGCISVADNFLPLDILQTVMARAELATHFHQRLDSRQPPINSRFLKSLIDQLGFILENHRHGLTLGQVQKFQNVIRTGGCSRHSF